MRAKREQGKSLKLLRTQARLSRNDVLDRLSTAGYGMAPITLRRLEEADVWGRSQQQAADKVLHALGVSWSDLRQADTLDPDLLDLTRNCIRFGKTKTLWVQYFGHDGQAVDWRNVRAILHPEVCLLDHPSLHGARRRTLSQMEADGDWNGPLLTAIRFQESAVPPSEEPKLTAHFVRSEFCDHKLLKTTDEGRHYALEAIRGWNVIDEWTRPQLSLGVGVHVCLFTSDNEIIIVERLPRKVRGGEQDVGAVEGLHTHHDVLRVKDASYPTTETSFDLKSTFYRSIKEEFGLLDHDINEIEFLGLGYDIAYFQWNFQGIAYLSIDVNTVRERYNTYRKNKEFSSISSTKTNAIEIAERLTHRRIWSSGLACLKYGLIRIFERTRRGSGPARFLSEFGHLRMADESQYSVRSLVQAC